MPRPYLNQYDWCLTFLPLACTTNCLKCFGPGANECTECDSGSATPYLENFGCVASCTSPNYLDTEDNICKSAKYDTENICPAGTYNPSAGGTSSGSCISCDGGKFCKSTGLSAVSGNCEEGYYCTSGAVYRANDDFLADDTGSITGGRCDAGNFCPSGASVQTTCTAGKYCSEDYLIAVSGDCLERYYCIGGTNAERPTDLSTEFGDICPAGSYCEAGVAAPTKCPAGKYQPNEGAASSTECLDCPPGSYCQSTGLSAPTGLCNEGFYCTGGNTSPSPATAICAAGFYCPEGSVQQIMCPEDSFQSSTAEAVCDTCPANSYCFESNTAQTCEAGYYCPGSNKKKACFPGKHGTVAGQATEGTACTTCPAGKACVEFGITTNYRTCKAGYYCLSGSISSIPKDNTERGGRCARGEFCPEGSSAVTACTAGKYCDRDGLSEPTGNCEAGYYCATGTTRQNPVVCPDGYYCPEGSADKTPCPIGTYRDAEGGTVLSDCYQCPEGYYCDTLAQTNPHASTCSAGFYCPEGQPADSPTSYECPAGYYCPAGSKIPKQCEVGTYQSQEGQSSCDPCPAGSYCDGSDTSTYITCIVGYYCPEGTRYSTEYPCPEGTYNDQTGRGAEGQCKNCPAGYYCDQKGQTTYSKQILAGYYNTEEKAVVPNPTDSSGVRGRCETGHYCPEGSDSPTPCPAGTYNNARGATSLDDCVNCPPGEYCNEAGKTYAELKAGSNWGLCTAGFVCYPGSTTPTPNDNIMGIICPAGYYCPEGTFRQIACPTGSYAPNQQ